MAYAMTATVEQFQTFNIRGPKLSFKWFKALTKKTGKPYLLANIILSELLYWFTPCEIYDPNTGESTGLAKKFKADLPQINYEAMAEKFGVSKRDIKNASDFLQDKGFIVKHFRTITTKDGMKLSNVLFWELKHETLMDVELGRGSYQNGEDPIPENGRGSYQNMPPSPTEMRKTNTVLTTGLTQGLTTKKEMRKKDFSATLPVEKPSSEPEQSNSLDKASETLTATEPPLNNISVKSEQVGPDQKCRAAILKNFEICWDLYRQLYSDIHKQPCGRKQDARNEWLKLIQTPEMAIAYTHNLRQFEQHKRANLAHNELALGVPYFNKFLREKGLEEFKIWCNEQPDEAGLQESRDANEQLYQRRLEDAKKLEAQHPLGFIPPPPDFLFQSRNNFFAGDS